MPQSPSKKRVRRDAEQLVADLQAKIEAIKARAARKRAKANPAVRYTVAAVRSMDKAMAATTDGVMRRALEEARGALSAYLAFQGVMPAASPTGRGMGGRRSSEDVEQMGASILAHVNKNPGQRGEQIAESLHVDTKTMRLPMQKLIADKKVKAKGERRGMRYYPA
jgi:predicted ArsR family transcriptional regulator